VRPFRLLIVPLATAWREPQKRMAEAILKALMVDDYSVSLTSVEGAAGWYINEATQLLPGDRSWMAQGFLPECN
jgi:hypothetical protein